QKNFIEFIIKNYIIFDAYTLSALTHSEKPWQQTPPNKKIEDKLIKEYYGKTEFAKNFPLGAKGKFYPLQTEFFYSFILDMDINKYHLLDTIYKFSDYQKLEEKSKKELFEILKRLDPERAKTIEKENPRRLIRAIEIAKKIGKVPPKRESPLPFPVLMIGIEKPLEELKKRIEKRFF
ncbi:MAG: hypothetical protein ACK4F0_08755, partial [Candidatus Ratteibacteria bacterium]